MMTTVIYLHMHIKSNDTKFIVSILIKKTHKRAFSPHRAWRTVNIQSCAAADSHTHSPFPTASVCEVQMKQRYSWLLSMSIKTWTYCPGHSISHSGQCVCVSVCVGECKLLPCLSSQPQLRARLKHRLKANQVTADGVRIRAVHSLVCVCVCVKQRKSWNHLSICQCVYRCVAENKSCCLTLFPWWHWQIVRCSMCTTTGVCVCVCAHVRFIFNQVWFFRLVLRAYVLTPPTPARLSAECFQRPSGYAASAPHGGWASTARPCRFAPSPGSNIKASYDCLSFSCMTVLIGHSQVEWKFIFFCCNICCKRSSWCLFVLLLQQPLQWH